MSEQQLQAKIIKYIFGIGGYTVKVVTATKSGIPDILACINGKFFAFEVKLPGNKPHALQIANIELIKASGGIAAVVYSLEDVMEVIHDLK